jgi:hypothetical protein
MVEHFIAQFFLFYSTEQQAPYGPKTNKYSSQYPFCILFSVIAKSSLAGKPMRTFLKETLKAEGRLEKGRPGFPVNVKRQVRLS